MCVCVCVRMCVSVHICVIKNPDCRITWITQITKITKTKIERNGYVNFPLTTKHTFTSMYKLTMVSESATILLLIVLVSIVYLLSSCTVWYERLSINF